MERFDIENSFLKNIKENAKLDLDYEIKNTKLDEEKNLNSKMYYFHCEIKKFSNNFLIKESSITIIIGIH